MRFMLILVMLLPVAIRAASINDEIIYFIMIDRFADGNPENNQDVDLSNPLAFQGGDLQGITANIDEIASLGATAIWITPIALQIDHSTQAEGKDFYSHHGYWAEDLTKIDPRFGTEADLIALRKAYPSLRGDAYEVGYSDKNVLVYARGDDTIVSINRSTEPQGITVEGMSDAQWSLEFTSTPDAQATLFRLPARSARIFVKNR